MLTSKEIADGVLDIERDRDKLDYNIIKHRYQVLLDAATSLADKDKELECHVAKRFFITAVSFGVSVDEVESVWRRLCTIGFWNDYSKFVCLCLFISWCETSRLVDRAIELLDQAERLLEKNKISWGATCYSHERVALEGCRDRVKRDSLG